jgi:FtsP/CotA-like multicopper oxidase with cupredoxin domain
MYGFGLLGETPTFPGPTILTTTNVPVKITWHNNISGLHVLNAYVAPSLLMPPTNCYPACGVPVVTHIHGMEVPASSDGIPNQAIYHGQSRTNTYNNSQMSSTHVYHDHSMGFTRLNHWSGLLGGYVIEDPTSPLEKALASLPDVLLMLTDTLVSTNKSLMYARSPCALEHTRWAPEAYGSVNAVNGVVAPYVNMPQQQVRLRIVNGANSRNYRLNIPFFADCQVIATDMGFVNVPYLLSSPDDLLLFPLERVEMVCDFTTSELGAVYNVTDVSNASGTEQFFDEVLQVRVSLPGSGAERVEIPDRTNRIKNLQALYEESPGAVRRIGLDEEVDAEDCPTKLEILIDGKVTSFEDNGSVSCTVGHIEKWEFSNPTADVHPFHWHAISVQCGATEDTVDTNQLKDTVQIPNKEGDVDSVTQVCYVACTPNDYLLEGSSTQPTDFQFDTTEPYVVHCHMLEHEENAMMVYFYLNATGE